MSEIISKKTIGLTGLTFAGINCIIGSGWLFGAYKAAKLAGPAAIYAWALGAAAIFLIALTYMELGAMLPRMGGMARYMDYTHGSLPGFLTGWINWLAIVSVIPVEAVASVQYISSWHWQLTQRLFDLQTGALSVYGLIFAALLIVIYFLINYWSMRLFVRFVIFVTAIKLAVPLLTIFYLLYSAFHPSNFTSYANTFLPYGWTGVLTAISTSGIVFAFHGFQSIINLSGEAKHPGRNIPLAIFLAIFSVLIIYLLLQIVFIGAISPSQIANGWASLVMSSPFVQLAIALNLNVLVLGLYVDAFISPSGTAMTYMATSSRMLYGMAQNKHLPAFLTFLDPKTSIPRKALWINLFIAWIFLLAAPCWEYLMPIVSLLGISSYLAGPVVAMTLRQLAPNLTRPIRIPAISFIAPLGFIIVSLILFWARWPLTGKVILIILLGFLFYSYYHLKTDHLAFWKEFKNAAWIVCYFLGIAVISFLGSAQFGGKNVIPFGWDMLAVVLFAIFIYRWSIKQAYYTSLLQEAYNSL